MVNTPVAILIFNRPETTASVFQAIRAARPSVLLVIADGPRPGVASDHRNCDAARRIVEQVDWPCDVLKNYSDKNLGLKSRVSSGLDWAFSCVEEAIVLEDDCVPHPSFFRYCDELLDCYRKDTRVISVSGDNYQRGCWRGDGSYYFSKYPTCWGWATWRRGWALFDSSMSAWPGFRDSGALRGVCADSVELEFWTSIFQRAHAGEFNSWAYAWVFASFVNHCVSPHPNRNLICNIGVGADATHTYGECEFANLPTQDLGAIWHPSIFVPNYDADVAEFDWTHGGAELRRRLSSVSISAPTIAGRVRRWLGRARREGGALVRSFGQFGR